MLTNLPLTPPHPKKTEADHEREVSLVSFTYNARREVLPMLADCLGVAGCWLLERRATAEATMQLRFEAPLHAVVEMYTSLVAVGLELTRDGHLALTSLCGLPMYAPRLGHARTVTVRLDVSFMDEMDQPVLKPQVASA